MLIGTKINVLWSLTYISVSLIELWTFQAQKPCLIFKLLTTRTVFGTMLVWKNKRSSSQLSLHPLYPLPLPNPSISLFPCVMWNPPSWVGLLLLALGSYSCWFFTCAKIWLADNIIHPGKIIHSSFSVSYLSFPSFLLFPRFRIVPCLRILITQCLIFLAFYSIIFYWSVHVTTINHGSLEKRKYI